MGVYYSKFVFPVFLFLIAVNRAPFAMAAAKIECTEISKAGTTADNKGPALQWTYLIVPAGPDAAKVSIDGFQTAIKLQASTAKKANGTAYRFSEYAPDSIHTRPELRKGTELFVLSNSKGGAVQLSFRGLKPNLDKKTIQCQTIPSADEGKR